MVVGSLLVCYVIGTLAHTIVSVTTIIASIISTLVLVSIAWVGGLICLPISLAIAKSISHKPSKADDKKLRSPIYELPPAFFSQPALQTSCDKPLENPFLGKRNTATL